MTIVNFITNEKVESAQIDASLRDLKQLPKTSQKTNVNPTHQHKRQAKHHISKAFQCHNYLQTEQRKGGFFCSKDKDQQNRSLEQYIAQ
jgi:hypothetical protein